MLFSPVFADSKSRPPAFRATAPPITELEASVRQLSPCFLPPISFIFKPFRTHLHDFAPTKKLTRLFSITSALFAKTTRGGGYPFSRHSPVSTLVRPQITINYPLSPQSLTKCSLRNSFIFKSIHFDGGVYPPSCAAERAGLIR